MERTFDWRPPSPEAAALGLENYHVSQVITTAAEVEQVWDAGPIIDQGSEGACVGFAWTNEFTADPFPDQWANEDVATRYALNHYHRARELDDFDDNVYTQGSSVLAGAKAAKERGLIGWYYWADTTENVRQALVSHGPVVLGIPWYVEMYSTDPAGRVIVHHDMNNLAGGHAILLTGYYPVKTFTYPDGRKETFERVFRWTNSWGRGYGDGGHGYITFADLDRLLHTYGWQGEACLPQSRKEPDLERILDPSIPPREPPEPPEPTMPTRGSLIDHAIVDLTRWLNTHPRRSWKRTKVLAARAALRALPTR